jgi:hypothetical protein
MRLTLVILTVGVLAACSPKPAAPLAAEPAQVAAPPKPAAPPKLVKMICRNSQTGKSVECGTPNAVMVGMTDK